MRFGAHLPQIDFDGAGHDVAGLGPYVDAARDLGFSAVTANDHLVFQRPWLDGLVALASVIDRTGDLTVATTVALPVVRGPVVLARTAAALNLLSGGRLVLGVAPGSSARDYAAVGVPFEERWSRFDAALTVLRAELEGESVPIWVGSWGSAAGLRRVARLGDGWLASAYNTTPERLAAGRESLDATLLSAGRDPTGFPLALATMWTYVTDDRAEAEAKLGVLASMLDRDPAVLAQQVLVGTADHCATILGSYADVGVETVFIWPVGDPVSQLQRFAEQVIPRARPAPSATSGQR
jgi:alkanesulfonate monooxygenase SsuD/methylene tetrahydromethanopterin reductase-like flavin-dependent oxidoreductase (luciferase family)